MTRKEAAYGLLRFFTICGLQIYALYSLFAHPSIQGVALAIGIVFGDTAAPSSISTYFDALFTQSLSNWRPQLIDQIGASNAFLYKILKSDMYESADGGTYIQEQLMYALSPMESYDGYDELATTVTDGVTEAIFEWRQLATPVSYSMKEIIQNRRKILDMVKTKMKQCEMGIQEGFAQNFMQGSGNGALSTAKVNAINGSSSINPLPLLVKYDPTTSTLVGNINQSTSTWWRNKTKTALITSSSGPTAFMAEWFNIYNSCALGTGGPPDICLVDQITYELCSLVLYDKYRQTTSDQNFPFTNIKLPFGNGKSLLVMDDKVPDVESGTTSTATYGTMYLLNSNFMKVRPIEGRDFEMLTDENGKSFQKPPNQDARIGHCAWMGQTTINNRRKMGVWGKIPRSLTF